MSENEIPIVEVDWDRARKNLDPDIYNYLFELNQQFGICPNLDYWEEQNIQNPEFEIANDISLPEQQQT